MPRQSELDLLLTGGAGFVGARFTELYHDAFANVFVVDDFSATPRVLSYPNVHYVRADISDASSLAALPAHVDVCVHLAAAVSVAESVADPEKYRRINVAGSRNVLEWCAAHGCRACVCASSAAVYGAVHEGRLGEGDADGGLSPYARTKFEMERLARELYPTCEGVPTAGEARPSAGGGTPNRMRINFVRPFNIYGPGQACGAHPSFIPAALRGALLEGRVTVCGDGRQTRDFVFVDDVCRALYALAVPGDTEEDTASSSGSSPAGRRGAPRHLQAYNVGTGRSTSIADLARRIADTVKAATGRDVRIEHAPARPQETLFSEADITRIQEAVGWAPTVGLGEGLRETFRWFQDEGLAVRP